MTRHHFTLLQSYVLVALIISSLAIIHKCPKECECRDRFQTVICELNITKSDTVLPEKTTVLFLRCRRNSLDLSSLQPRMFQKLSALTSIIFVQCDFDYRNQEILTSFNYSEELYIDKTINFTIHPNIFHLFRYVRSLKIVESATQGLSPDSLCVLNNVTNLVLVRNGIRSFSEVLNLCSKKRSFFSQLITLVLDFNEIQILRSGFAKRFQNLRSLSFTGNRIEEIQNGSLVNLPRLQYLDISQNYLQKLPDEFLAGCPELIHLNIANNPISKIPQSVTRLHKLGSFHAINTSLRDISLLINMSLVFLEIRNSGLTMIPSPFCGNHSILERLDLSQNKIREITVNVFDQCSSLESLVLSDNNIESLYRKSFNGLVSLKGLSLSMNEISYISERTFSAFNNLKMLNMSFNLLKEIPSLPHNVLMIDFTGNKIKDIYFLDSTQARFIKHMYFGNNRIERIKNYAFLNCPNLLKMNLKKNLLKTFEAFAFDGLYSLKELNIAYNYLESLHFVLNPLSNLKELKAEHNLLSTLKRNTFPKSLRKINLSKNKIKTIEEGTFENLKDLEMVDLRWNEMVSLDSSSLKLDPNIVAVSHFSIFGNPLNCDCHLASLKNNSVSKYPIFTDLAPSECLQHDIYYLQAAYFESTDDKQFVCGYKRNSLFKLPFSCYLNCQCCLTENCLCQHKCTENCLCTFRYDLTDFRVDCKNGNVTDGTGIPPNATLIDLSDNDLGYLTNETFIRQTKAEMLYLNHSKITGIGERTFITFNMLKVLHLEYNEIRILDSNSLLGLRKLKELILNHNEIERISPGTFNVTASLEVLDLSHNNLRKIDSQTLNVDSLKTIVLFENPWSCTCEDVNILSTYLINRFSQINSQQILCNHSETPIVRYYISFCQNKSSNRVLEKLPARDKAAVYGSSLGFTTIVIIFVVGAFLYRYYIEIKIMLFVRFGWRIMFKKNRLDEEDKKYDAFVSYHNSQDEFVIREMLPRLEGINPAYKLCVHFRDFAVGAPIVDNITESIENSKRTILLLTDQFLTSEWCRYEFQAAHLESLSNKMNSLILVLLEDVNPDLVDGELKLYMKTKTYLRYDAPRFWDKLRFALPELKDETEL